MMRSNVVRGLVFALLPTLLLSSPALGDESTPTQLLNTSTNVIPAPANLNTEPEQTSQSVPVNLFVADLDPRLISFE